MVGKETDALEYIKNINTPNNVDEESDIIVGTGDDIFAILKKDTKSREVYDKSEYPIYESIRERLERKKLEKEEKEIQFDITEKAPKKDLLDIIKESTDDKGSREIEFNEAGGLQYVIADDKGSKEIKFDEVGVKEQVPEKDILDIIRESAMREDYASSKVYEEPELLTEQEVSKKKINKTLSSIKTLAKEKLKSKRTKKKPEETLEERLVIQQEELMNEIRKAKKQLDESNEYVATMKEVLNDKKNNK
ncbi:hypothetical protein KKG31_01730 [Patescibacteria group bacterium]|nr:hypothetical protein [Patescibacteria group bacterium]MBU1757893.1 hypothetical protein [Patescibacteria group bacterium]